MTSPHPFSGLGGPIAFAPTDPEVVRGSSVESLKRLLSRPDGKAVIVEAARLERITTGRAWGGYSGEELKRLSERAWGLVLLHDAENRPQPEPKVWSAEELAEFDRYVAWLLPETKAVDHDR